MCFTKAARLGACLLMFTVAFAAFGQIEFVDIATDPSSGLSYERVPSARDETYDQIKAMDVITAPQSIFVTPLFARGVPGVVVFDHDGDGDLDLYVTNGPGRANSLFSNQFVDTGQLSFVDVGDAAGVGATDQDSYGACAGDIDNDGDQDLFVVNYKSPNRLFANNGDGTFTDISASAGVDESTLVPFSAGMGDVNNDGWIDIYVGNYADCDNLAAMFVDPYSENQHNALYMNNGDNTFTNATAASGLADAFPTLTNTVALADYDMDGDVDIFTANEQGAFPESLRGSLEVFNNDGHGFFTDVTDTVGTRLTGSWMGYGFADFNHDGHMDFFQTNLGDLAGGFPGSPAGSRPFFGQADGTFLDGSDPTVLSVFGWGSAVFDADNDGDTDIAYHGGDEVIYVVDASNPGTLMINDGTGKFTNNVAAFGNSIRHIRRMVHGMAAGDLNNDGYVDVISVSNFDYSDDPGIPWVVPPLPGFVFDGLSRLLQSFVFISGNEYYYDTRIPKPTNGTLAVEINSGGTGNNWADISLKGMHGATTNGKVNRDALGAVAMFTPDGGKTAMDPVVGGSSASSQHSLHAIFGMGDAETGTLEVLWPGGIRNRLIGVRAGERLTVPEIPYSIDDDSMTFGEYLQAVRDHLSELVDNGIVDQAFANRMWYGALRGFYDINLGYKTARR